MPRYNYLLLEGNIGKPKTLPLYEEDNRLNFYIRSRRSPYMVQSYFSESNVLHPVLHGGNFWTGIKKFFKKGKNALKNTMDFIDQSPLLSTIKDIGFDYIKSKTNVDPNMFYDTTRNVVNMNKQNFQDLGKKMINTTYKTVKDNLTNNQKTNYKNLLKNYYDDIVQTVPQYKSQVSQNYNLFSSGNEISGSDNEVILRNLPKLLVMSKTSSGNFTVKKEFQPLLLKYGIKTLTVPKTLKDFAHKVMMASNGRLNLGSGEESQGRLNLGKGNSIQPPKQNTTGGSTKNKYNRYNEILEKLKH